MRTCIATLLAATTYVACASRGEPYEETMELEYRHSFDFMWENVIEALGKHYDIAEANRETRTITTDWRTNLAVMSHFGYRTRLIVTLDGSVTDGWTVTVKEEAEKNVEQVNPLAESKAEWKPTDSDGGTAARFRVSLYRRLNPRQDWRDADVR